MDLFENWSYETMIGVVCDYSDSLENRNLLIIRLGDTSKFHRCYSW